MPDEITTTPVPLVEAPAHAEVLGAALAVVADDLSHDAERDTRSELHKLFDLTITEAEKLGHELLEEFKALRAKL